MANQMDLIKNASAIDASIYGPNGEKAGERSFSAAPDTGSTAPIMTDGSKTAKKTSAQQGSNATLSEGIAASIHPFGYNDNNRMVAERVVRDEKRFGNKPQAAVTLTAGEASAKAIEAADAFENANPESVVGSTTAQQHVQDAQRQEIISTRAVQVAALQGATAPPPPPAPVEGSGAGTDTAATDKPKTGQGAKAQVATGFAPPPPPAK